MWREKIINFAKNLVHPAWGFSHFRRIYELTIELAAHQERIIDEDCIFAAAYLHDIGAFKPYKQEGKDHGEVAVQNCDKILQELGFPQVKIPKVKEIISSHMFYNNPSNNIESILFHDADTLDFMGIIGITRILSIVGVDDWTPDLASALKIVRKFCNELPQKLYSVKAKEIGNNRKKEMIDFLDKLSAETNDLKLL